MVPPGNGVHSVLSAKGVGDLQGLEKQYIEVELFASNLFARLFRWALDICSDPLGYSSSKTSDFCTS